jgi:hypothetical protein
MCGLLECKTKSNTLDGRNCFIGGVLQHLKFAYIFLAIPFIQKNSLLAPYFQRSKAKSFLIADLELILLF